MKKTVNIFDELAASLPKKLGPDEMTVDRFAKINGLAKTAARRVLEQAVADGKLRKEHRVQSREFGGGTNPAVYIPVVK